MMVVTLDGIVTDVQKLYFEEPVLEAKVASIATTGDPKILLGITKLDTSGPMYLVMVSCPAFVV